MAVALVTNQELAGALGGVPVHLVQPVLDVLEGLLWMGEWVGGLLWLRGGA